MVDMPKKSPPALNPRNPRITAAESAWLDAAAMVSFVNELCCLRVGRAERSPFLAQADKNQPSSAPLARAARAHDRSRRRTARSRGTRSDDCPVTSSCRRLPAGAKQKLSLLAARRYVLLMTASTATFSYFTNGEPTRQRRKRSPRLSEAAHTVARRGAALCLNPACKDQASSEAGSRGYCQHCREFEEVIRTDKARRRGIEALWECLLRSPIADRLSAEQDDDGPCLSRVPLALPGVPDDPRAVAAARANPGSLIEGQDGVTYCYDAAL